MVRKHARCQGGDARDFTNPPWPKENYFVAENSLESDFLNYMMYTLYQKHFSKVELELVWSRDSRLSAFLQSP